MLRSVVLPLLSGLLTVLCFPGWNHGQLAWVALVPLLLSLTASKERQAFQRGFLAGLAANLGTLYWVYPTCRAGGVNPFAAALALASLAGYCALYWGAFALIVRRAEKLPAWSGPFIGAAVWAALEMLRAGLLTGFPWLLYAYSQWNVVQHLPLASVGGPYIVSSMLVLFNGMAALLARRRWRAASPAFGALILLVAASVALSRRAERRAAPPSLNVAVVQGNIDQYKKWDQAYEAEIIETYTRLTREAADGETDLILWPETSVPGWLPGDKRLMAWVGRLARECGTHLLVGAVTRGEGDYNAAFLFSPAGEPVAAYRKRHLVPFGERVPLQNLLGRWVPVLGELGRFDASDDWTVFEIPGGRFGVNICFESLFPGIVKGFIARGAGFTVNMTNDGWFLDTAAAEQHLAAAPFRSVENRVWTVCATNTGISAVVDPAGRIVARTKLGERAVLRARIAVAGQRPAPGP